MKTKKYMLVVLSILLILLVFTSQANAADANTTEALSIDESANMNNNLLSVDNNIKSKVSNDELLTDWYVNSSKTSSGNGKTSDSAFMSLNEAISSSSNGDTINIASGEYKGENNTGLTIDKNLNFIKYGDSDAIFDAESQRRIWTVSATSTNITGLTFKNGNATGSWEEGYGGAIYFNNSHSNFNINATFINNTAQNKGGGIYIESSVFGNLTGTFNNNTADSYGGAIYIKNNVSGNLTGTFNNNTAGYGAAIYIYWGDVSGHLTGSFINNRAKGDGGGAVHIERGDISGHLSGSFINNIAKYDGAAISCDAISGILTGSFINNKASRGGAIFIYGEVSGNLTGFFINNAASSYGGAIYHNSDVSGSITGSYINNTAVSYGGAIYLNSGISGSITGTFINNTANYDGGSIFINDNLGENANIKDSIFINNNKNTIISTKGNITVTKSWFGNNATNYNTKPAPGNVSMDNWLFLNGTANPGELDAGETSAIEFKLDSYNDTSKDVNPYDASKMNVRLELSQTLGELDKITALIGEKIIYTAKKEGNATITGKFETASYTINLKNNESEPIPTSITVDPTSLNLTVGETASLIAALNPTEAGILNYDYDDKIISIETGSDGVWTVSALAEGKTNITFSFAGNDKYAPCENKTVNVAVNAKPAPSINVLAENLTKYYHGPEQFSVNVTDDTGKGISGKRVLITINAKSYNRTTDEKGTAHLNINLNSGNYPLNVRVDDITVNASVTVLTTVNGTDIIKVFRNDTQYYATFIDSQGNYLKDGETVRFNIHGITYERKVSGGKGLAKLNINLEEGKYTITTINTKTGEMSSNNITVLSRITENSDLTKYYRNASQYTVKIIGDDGKVVGAGVNVTFNINGVMYARATNASGIAKLNINLEAGDYIITAEYKNCRVSNNIKVLPVLTAKDMVKKYGAADQFVATLVDGEGNPYAKQTVQFNVNGVLYNRETDSTGQAKLNIRLMAGQYIITSSYNGCNIANKITVQS